MSQSIDLSNISNVIFDWAPIEKINLNGSMIWEGMVAVNIFGEHVPISGEKTISAGLLGLQGPVVYGPGNNEGGYAQPHQWNFLPYNRSAPLAPASQDPYYKGFSILACRSYAANADTSGGVSTNPDTVLGNGSFAITIAGDHPKNFFNSITLNGRVFSTADLTTNSAGVLITSHRHAHGTNLPRDFTPTDLLTATSWQWSLYAEAVQYYVFNVNVNNVLEFR
tara:strand:- start:2537 stop:3205 length:669 start_codon:yes stop_codon:yes gene_type:complete